MRVISSRAGLATLVVILGCQLAPPQFSEQDAATVRGLFDSVVTDVRTANWTAWAGRFAEDARFHPSNGPAILGRPAILAWGQAFPPIESFSFENVQVAGEGNLAYGTSAVLIKIRDLPADTAKQLVVLRRDTSAGWQVLAVSVTSDLPPPQPGAPTPRR
jgi:ketosteroid isomerase-like protein